MDLFIFQHNQDSNIIINCISHERIIRIFKPLPISGFTGFLGYLLGNTAELKNFDKVISSGEGREVTRVKSVGYVKVKFHVTLINFDKFGYM